LDHQFPSAAFEPLARSKSGVVRESHFADAHGLDFRSGEPADAVHLDATVDDGIVVADDDVIHHGRVVVDRARLVGGHMVTVIMAAVEVLPGHKRVAVRG
jgi:hypothetical protein